MLLSFPYLCIAQNNDFNLYYYNSSKQRKFEQTTSYLIYPAVNWLLQINGKNSEDKRIDFDQTSRNSFLNLIMQKQASAFNHRFEAGYTYLFDQSNLDIELNPYQNRSAFLGYGTHFNLIDSLFLGSDIKAYYQDEQDRYFVKNRYISQGLMERVYSTYFTGEENRFVSVAANWESKALDWESYHQASASFSTFWTNDNISFNSATTYASRQEDLYVLQSPDTTDFWGGYKKYDRQFVKRFNTSLSATLPLGEKLSCSVNENYFLQDYEHQTNKNRNSGNYNNLAQVNFQYQLMDNIELKSLNSHNYYIKDLSYSKNSRIIDNRTSVVGGSWNYNAYDSLNIDYTIDLKRTLYPDSGHNMDNDLLSEMYRLNWIVFWKNRLRIGNRLLYINKEEVFIDSDLSANNNTATSLQWQPESDLLIGDSFLLHQNYQIRADYDNYNYNSFSNIKDTFYRLLGCSYRIVYDSSPLAAKLSYPKWYSLPFRGRNFDATRLELGYTWEKNETSAKEGDIYFINGIIERQSISGIIQKQYGFGIYQLSPKYSWGYWKEYNLIMSALWMLNSNSTAEIIINPIGSDIDALDWRVSCSVNLLF